MNYDLREFNPNHVETLIQIEVPDFAGNNEAKFPFV